MIPEVTDVRTKLCVFGIDISCVCPCIAPELFVLGNAPEVTTTEEPPIVIPLISRSSDVLVRINVPTGAAVVVVVVVLVVVVVGASVVVVLVVLVVVVGAAVVVVLVVLVVVVVVGDVQEPPCVILPAPPVCDTEPV